MNMKKMIFAMAASVVVVVGASPASATVYQYIVNRKDVVNTSVDTITLDNVNGTGSWTSTDNGLTATFKIPIGTVLNAGITPGGGSINLTNFVGTRVVNGVRYGENLSIQQPVLSFSQSGVVGDISVLAASWGTGQGGNLAFGITGFKDITPVTPPTSVPEPAMLGLFGAGAVMVMMGRRRRSNAKAQGGARLAMA